jgi:hypothetical protein
VITVKSYQYQGAGLIRVWLAKATGLASIILSTVFAAGLIWAAGHSDGPVVTVACLVIWILAFGWGLGLLFFNAYPAVHVDDAGLTVEFLFGHVQIAWADVAGVKSRSFPWSNSVVVMAKRITPFHRLYGWYYARRFSPAFLVADIAGRGELLDVIRRASGNFDEL